MMSGRSEDMVSEDMASEDMAMGKDRMSPFYDGHMTVG
jgi:hypothetical protein